MSRFSLPSAALPALAWIALCFSLAAASSSPTPAPQKIDFNRDIRPILSDHCFACHGPDDAKRKAGLRLDRAEDALKPLKSGKTAIHPSQPNTSELVRRILTDDPDDRMPPAEFNRPLSPAQKDLLNRWVAQGAPYQIHWAFQSPTSPPPPPIKSSKWARNPIDQFVAARLEKEGLAPQPEADRTTLIRRVTLDLTGLPPSLDEIEAFLSDRSSKAYEKLVDRLLDSRHYGERMAVDWMDAARYADTHGYHIDSARDMTPWRDAVIDAFHKNQPYDQFTIEQLAGDLLPNATPAQKIASGFNRNHMLNYEGGAIADEYHTAYIIDRINTTATVWLGLTLACAQCHDHKYDPITQRDYYGFYAFFNGVQENGLDGRWGNANPVLRLHSDAEEAQLAGLKSDVLRAESLTKELEDSIPARADAWRLKISPNPAAAGLKDTNLVALVQLDPAQRSPDQTKRLQDAFRDQFFPELKEARATADRARKARDHYDRALPTSMIMNEMEKPRDTFILQRGDYDKKGEKIGRFTPAFLPPMKPGEPLNRLGLARWLVDPAHPLTARVTVNRYWQLFFGNGIVKSSENFGSQADWPSHPELLDWLATEFVRSGWDVRALNKRIVLSATYRQSAAAPRELFDQDPENRLLARGPRVRLQAEFIRDLALSVSGLLDPRIGGASVFPYQPSGLWEELMAREDGDNFTAQKYVASWGNDLYRRSMYTFWKRTCPPPNLVTFDAPDRQVCTVRRPRTNTPLQALVLLNDPTYVECARKLAERLARHPGSDRDRVVLGFRLVTSRAPNAKESAVLLQLLQSQRQNFLQNPAHAQQLLRVGDSQADASLDPATLAAWTLVANALLNLDETITKG